MANTCTFSELRRICNMMNKLDGPRIKTYYKQKDQLIDLFALNVEERFEKKLPLPNEAIYLYNHLFADQEEIDFADEKRELRIKLARGELNIPAPRKLHKGRSKNEGAVAYACKIFIRDPDITRAELLALIDAHYPKTHVSIGVDTHTILSAFYRQLIKMQQEQDNEDN